MSKVIVTDIGLFMKIGIEKSFRVISLKKIE